MKKIRQYKVAKYIGVKPPFLNMIKKGKRGFGRDKAREISELTGIPFETLIFESGEKLYQMLVIAYAIRREHEDRN